MKKIISLSMATIFVTATLVASTTQASAHGRRHHQQVACAAQPPIGELAVLGLLLGAVTGGVGSAVAYGGAYALGGAAIGGGSGLLLGAVHNSNRYCR